MTKPARRGGAISATFRRKLIAYADAYGKAKNLSRSQVSKRCYGRGNFLDEFKAGTQSPSLAIIDQILDYFREYWPEGPRLEADVTISDGG